MKFCVDFLSSHSRKELQTLAKDNGIKANASNATIIQSLLSLTSTTNCGSPAADNDAVSTKKETESVSIDEILPVSDNSGHLVERGLGGFSCAVIDEIEQSSGTDCTEKREFVVGSSVEVFVDDVWIAGVIVKQNKKSYRVRFDSNGEESLIKCNHMRLATLQIGSQEGGLTEAVCAVNEDIEVAPTSALLFFSAKEFESNKVITANATQSSKSCGKIADCSDTGGGGESREILRCKSSEKPHFGERQRSIGGTPVKSLSRPIFMPKSTKNQRVRLDASHLKRTTLSDVGSRKASSICMPSIGSGQSSEQVKTPLLANVSDVIISRPPNLSVSSGVKPKDHRLSSALLSSPLRSTPSKQRNGVPNFQKMHQRMMSNLKPITALVKRDQSVGSRMTTAMAEVLKSPAVADTGSVATSSSNGPSAHSTKPSSTTTPVVPCATSSTKATNALLPKTVPFKARTMPNFKALHSKLPVKTTSTPVADKENSSLPFNAGSAPRRQSLKDTKPLAGTKINNRKESILKGRQEKREERVSLSRMAR